MNMILLTKEYKFCAAHKYWNPNWDEKKNIEVFGEDVRNHGHNYILRLTVKGSVNNESGFLVDLQWLNDLVKNKLIKFLDHSQIDQDIDWFRDRQPSTENLVVYIWDTLSPYFENQECSLYKIFLRETPTIFTEYYGPSINSEVQ
tara:strand:+ start:52 stop:486 length:435 start_codon:yes stop_codon:yes gene_type:complete